MMGLKHLYTNIEKEDNSDIGIAIHEIYFRYSTSMTCEIRFLG